MMLPEGHGLYPGHPDLRGFVRFLNLSTGALVRAHLPLLDDHVILDSVDGLLLLHRDRDTAMRLLHPFTSEIVDLPPLASLLPQVETLRFYPRSLTMNPYASVSVSSRGAVTVMLAFTDLDRVAYATDGDQQWTLWEPFMSLLSSDLSKKKVSCLPMVRSIWWSTLIRVRRYTSTGWIHRAPLQLMDFLISRC
jgi:hypothetical protein